MQFGYDHLYGDIAFASECVWDFGGETLDKDGRKCLLDSPNAVAGLEYLQDLLHKHRVMPTAQDKQGADLAREGRLAMEEIWRSAVVNRRTWSINWDVAPRPKGKGGQQTLFMTNAMSIAAPTKVPDAAWLAATFLTGPEVDRSRVRAGFETPLKTNVDLLLANKPPENNQYWVDAAKYGKPLQNPAMSELFRIYGEEMAPVWQNTRAPRDAVRTLVPKIDAALTAVPR
jgi:multiple sugar transport system substrate-binding protein